MLEAIQSASKDKPVEPSKPVILGADGKPLAAEPEKKPGETEPKVDDKGEKPDDLTTMPDGLAPKAQQRFQKLVETNKELTQQTERLQQGTEYFTSTLRENRISQPQFELATKTVGMINSGDYQGALKVLQEQMQQVAVLAGVPVPGIDALAGHADLRGRVDAMEITEQDAMQLAQARVTQQRTQQQAQRQQQERAATEQQQATEQAAHAKVQQATTAVDQLCSTLQRTDLDFARIEAILVPQIAELLADVPPEKWVATVQRQYTMLKSVGIPNRGGSPPAGSLRPGGADNPQAQPKDMFEAMFKTARPA